MQWHNPFDLWEAYATNGATYVHELAQQSTRDLILMRCEGDTQMLKCMAGFVHFGRKVVPVLRAVEDELRQLDLGAVTMHDLGGHEMSVMLWPGYYVALEDSTLKLVDADTGVHQLAGFYVMASTVRVDLKDRSVEHAAAWEFLLCGRPNENSISPLDDALFSFTLAVCFNNASLKEALVALPDWADVEEEHKRSSEACVAIVAALTLRLRAGGRA